MKIAEIIEEYKSKFDYIDLEIIIAHSLKKTREFILTHPEQAITKKQETIIKKNIARRIKSEPIAYITGYKGFYGLDFIVNKNTLIPRPETELLVEEVIKFKPKNYLIADIGTGSGNIIISLAKNISSKNNYLGIDISKEALRVAKLNAKKHKLDKKISFLNGDLLFPLLKNNKLTKLKPNKLIIVANLPYLDTGWKNLLKSSETKGLKFEPCVALYAGKDGLDTYRKLADQLRLFNKKMKNDITVFCEIGHLQAKSMHKIFSFAKNIKFFEDFAGKWRVCKISL
jgi:release factor glutamine methyltransferase